MDRGVRWRNIPGREARMGRSLSVVLAKKGEVGLVTTQECGY